MKPLSAYSLVELRWVIALREKVEELQGELDAIIGESAVSTEEAHSGLISSPAALTGPVIYEFRLAHK